MHTQLTKADVLDFNCPIFGWRGQYRILGASDDGLARIENLGTGSKQYVRPERLRRSRLQRFSIWDR